MKAFFPVVLSILIALFVFSCAYAENGTYNLSVKKLYADPSLDSKVVFEIPVDIALLEISEDANWYKVYIRFVFGFAEFKYTGWAYIPIGEVLAKREAKNEVITVLK